MASQSASPAGHHNIIVQACGDGIHVQVGLPWLELIPAERRVRKEPRREIDILDPVFQAVPLVARDSDLDFLRRWLAEERDVAITALTGAGGSGKTRLALELLQTMPEQWQGGFLTAQEARRFLNARNLASWSWQKPILIVVDYAALIAETLANWFRELADHPVPEHPLRILLLERHADKDKGWYGDLTDGSFAGRRVRELFSPVEPIEISPLTELGQRRSVLAAALQAAAKLKPDAETGVSLIPPAGADAWFEQRLAHDQWKDPLLLLMAAVIAASSGMHAALKLSRPELAKELANRERARVRNSVEDPAAKDLLVYLYACITLCGGLTRENAAAVAEQEFSSKRMQYPGGPGRAAKDLATLLGGQDWLPPMTPDLLGEAFLLVVFGETGSSVIARLGSLASDRVAAAVIRSVQDFSHWGEPAPMEWAKALVAQGERDSDILLAIEEALPRQTIALRPLAVDVTQSVIHRSQSSEPSERSLADLSRLWNNLSLRQKEMGQRTEALASIIEAVGIRRALAEANPNAFLPKLAMSLNNQALMQSEMGQGAEALASIAEAVRHYRALAEANPDAFLPEVAMSLNNQANRQSEMGQRAEALASIAEAVRRYRALAEANPDAFLPNLAASLNNKASMQSEVGKRAQALASIAEAVRHYRALAEANPDAFLADLAMSLNNQANRQSGMGQRPEALTSIAEAVRIRRALTEANPDAFLPDLAMSLNNQANMQSAMGQRPEALASIAEAVRHYRALAEANADGFLPELAGSLNNQASMQSEMGQRPEALASIAEAVRHCRALADANPAAFLPQVAGSLNNQASMQSEMGQRAEALTSIAEAVRHYRALAQANPAAFLPDVAMSLNNQANRQREMGQRADALTSIAEAVRHYRALAEANADAFLPDLAKSLSVQGDCLASLERLSDARDAAGESLLCLAPFYARYPGVFDSFAKATLRDYLLRTKELGEEPDLAVLIHYTDIFKTGERQ